MEQLNTSKLENQLIQSINKLLHQQPQIIDHERLNFLASNFAHSIIKSESKIESSDHSNLFPDALRYKEINFVFSLNGSENNMTNETVINSLITYIKEKYMDIISCSFNSVGKSIQILPSNEILVIIFLAYFKPKIPEDTFRQKMEDVSDKKNSATDLSFLINLLNIFRGIINLPILTLSSVAEESQVVQPNMNLTASFESTIKASYAVEVFQTLLSDKNFDTIISDIWFGFTIKNHEDVTLLKFWRKKEFAEYKFKLVYIPNPNFSPNLDIDKILGYSNSSSANAQQKQRPGRKNPPTSQQAGVRPGKGHDAWKNFSDQQSIRGNSSNNNNSNRGGNWKKKTYPPRQQYQHQPNGQQQQQQLQFKQQYQHQQPQPSNTSQPRNTAWDLTTQNLHQENPMQYTNNSYASWKHQNQRQVQRMPQQQQQPIQQIQEQQNDPIEEHPEPQEQSSQQQPASKGYWSNFQVTEFDDKNAYKRLPVNMRISHQKNVEQPKPQGRKGQFNRQHQQQNQQSNQQHSQSEVASTHPENKQSSTSTDVENKWNEIKSIFDVRKNQPDLKRNRRDKPQQRPSNQQPQSNTESEKPATLESEQQNNSVWSKLNTNLPYDDTQDVRKLPPELRRSHQQFDMDEKKKKMNKMNQEKKEQRKQAKPSRQSKANQNQKQNSEPPQKVEEEPPKKKVENVWTRLNLQPVSQEQDAKKKQKQQQQRQQKQNEQISASSSVESNQTEQQTQQQPEAQNVAENVQQQQQPEVSQEIAQQQQQQPEETEQQQEEEPQPAPTPAKVSIWSSISESLTAPKKSQPKPQPQQQPVQPEPEPVAQPQPEQQQEPVQQEPAEQNAAPEAVQNQEEAPVEEAENAEPEEEVKSLAPPPEIVNAWAGIRSTKHYDDKNDYRKTPAELRRSHAPATAEQSKQKKNQKSNKPQKQPKQQPQQQQQQQPPQEEAPAPAVEQPPQPEEEQQQQQQVQEPEVVEPEAPIAKKPSWAVLPDTPYDDKYDMRKLPPELRRTHNPQPADKSKKDKKAKKDKDWTSDKKKEKSKDARRNPLISQPEPEAPKEEVQQQQPENVEEVQQPQEEPVQEKKSVWSTAVPDQPYDDKNHLSKIPPQLRRTHKLNEEKEKEKEKAREASKQQNKDRRNQNKNQKQQQQQRSNTNENEGKKESQEEEPPKKNLSPWASFNITPVAPKPKPQPKQQPQPPQQQQEQQQQEQPNLNENVAQNGQNEPEVKPQPEPQQQQQQETIENEPAPNLIKKEVHKAWASINLQSKP